VEDNGEFILNLLTQRTGPDPAEPPRPPEMPSLTVVNSLPEMQAAANRVAAGANRLISIYTPNLEVELYDQTEFLDIVKRFVLGRNFAKVRVLLEDASRLIRSGNRFVAMAKRLTSYIDIRLVRNRLPQRAAAYIIADDRAIMLRTDMESADAIADFNNPAIARAHLAEFDASWIANQPEPLFHTIPRRAVP
jgi:hypothetical protein